ncbi:MAG: hypothetical protein GXO40_02905 [Epsilonproteobacteria bacterium]|nr:hypothetical protein [Campylobacterota bacterium]
MISQDKIIELYVAMFQRAPSKAEVDYWYNDSVEHDYTETQLAQNMVNGAIAATKTYNLTDLYPSYANLDLSDYDSIKSVIESVYQTLFDKDYNDDPSGIDYWASTVYNGDKTLGEAILDIVNVALDIPTHPDTWREYYLDHGYSEDYFDGALNAAKTYINRVEAAKEIANSVDSIDLSNQTQLKEDIQTMKDVVVKIKDQDDINSLKEKLDEGMNGIKTFVADDSSVDNIDNTESTDSVNTQYFTISNGILQLTTPAVRLGTFDDFDFSGIKQIIGTNEDDWFVIPSEASVDDKIDVDLQAGNDTIEIPAVGFRIDGGDGVDIVSFDTDVVNLSDDDLVNVEDVRILADDRFDLTHTQTFDLSNQSENNLSIFVCSSHEVTATTTHQDDTVYVCGGSEYIDPAYPDYIQTGGDVVYTLDGDDKIYVKNGYRNDIFTGAGADTVYITSKDAKETSIDVDPLFEIGKDKIVLNTNEKAFNFQGDVNIATNDDGFIVTSSNSDVNFTVVVEEGSAYNGELFSSVSLYYHADIDYEVLSVNVNATNLTSSDIDTIFDFADLGVL